MEKEELQNFKRDLKALLSGLEDLEQRYSSVVVDSETVEESARKRRKVHTDEGPASPHTRPWSQLNESVLVTIMHVLPFSSLTAARRVCRAWRTAVDASRTCIQLRHWPPHDASIAARFPCLKEVDLTSLSYHPCGIGRLSELLRDIATLPRLKTLRIHHHLLCGPKASLTAGCNGWSGNRLWSGRYSRDETEFVVQVPSELSLLTTLGELIISRSDNYSYGERLTHDITMLRHLVLPSLPRLTSLALHAVDLGVLTTNVQHLTGLEDLELIWFRQLGIMLANPWGFLTKMTRLKALDISCGQLSSIPIELSCLVNLESLRMNGNGITNWSSLSRLSTCLTALTHICAANNNSNGQWQVPFGVQDAFGEPIAAAAAAVMAAAAAADGNGILGLAAHGHGIVGLAADGHGIFGLEAFQAFAPESASTSSFNLLNRPTWALKDVILSECELRTLPQGLASASSITSLDISCNLLPIFSTSISSLLSLKYLDASYNRLSTLPISIGGMSELTQLELQKNRLETISPLLGWQASTEHLSNEVFGTLKRFPMPYLGCTALKSLDVSNNRLKRIPYSFRRLTQLEILNLSENRFLPVSELVHLERCTALTSLVASGLGSGFPRFMSADTFELPEALGNLVNLQSLNLSNNRLRSLPASLCRMTELMFLDIGKNLMTALPPVLWSLSALIELSAPDNMIHSLDPAVSHLESLAHLDLSGNALETVPAGLWSLPALKHLDLSANALVTIQVQKKVTAVRHAASQTGPEVSMFARVAKLKESMLNRLTGAALPSAVKLEQEINTEGVFRMTDSKISELSQGKGIRSNTQDTSNLADTGSVAATVRALNETAAATREATAQQCARACSLAVNAYISRKRLRETESADMVEARPGLAGSHRPEIQQGTCSSSTNTAVGGLESASAEVLMAAGGLASYRPYSVAAETESAEASHLHRRALQQQLKNTIGIQNAAKTASSPSVKGHLPSNAVSNLTEFKAVPNHSGLDMGITPAQTGNDMTKSLSQSAPGTPLGVSSAGNAKPSGDQQELQKGSIGAAAELILTCTGNDLGSASMPTALGDSTAMDTSVETRTVLSAQPSDELSVPTPDDTVAVTGADASETPAPTGTDGSSDSQHTSRGALTSLIAEPSGIPSVSTLSSTVFAPDACTKIPVLTGKDGCSASLHTSFGASTSRSTQPSEPRHVPLPAKVPVIRDPISPSLQTINLSGNLLLGLPPQLLSARSLTRLSFDEPLLSKLEVEALKRRGVTVEAVANSYEPRVVTYTADPVEPPPEWMAHIGHLADHLLVGHDTSDDDDDDGPGIAPGDLHPGLPLLPNGWVGINDWLMHMVDEAQIHHAAAHAPDNDGDFHGNINSDEDDDHEDDDEIEALNDADVGFVDDDELDEPFLGDSF